MECCHKITSKSCSSSPVRACAYFVTQTSFERKERNSDYRRSERAIGSKKKVVDLSSNTRYQKNSKKKYAYPNDFVLKCNYNNLLIDWDLQSDLRRHLLTPEWDFMNVMLLIENFYQELNCRRRNSCLINNSKPIDSFFLSRILHRENN